MPLLVTGVDGFIGSHLAAHLASAGFDVIGIGRQAESDDRQKPARLRYIQHDLTTSLASVPLGEKPSAIIHSAGTTLRPGVPVQSLVENNVLATLRLLRFAEKAGVKRFIYFSTVSVHGEVTEPLLSVSTAIRNPSSYGLTKHLCELLIAEATDIPMRLSLRLPAVLARGAVVHWLSVAVERAIGNQPIRIFNPDTLFNSAVHMSDLQSFVVHLLGRDWSGFDVFPMGSRAPMPIRAVVDRIISRSESRSPVELQRDGRPSFLIDNSRAEQAFGYRPMEVRQAIDLYLDEILSAGQYGAAMERTTKSE